MNHTDRLTVMQIRKRDESRVAFDETKISRAIAGAWEEAHDVVDDTMVQRATEEVVEALRASATHVDRGLAQPPIIVTHVEEVQDAVEVALMRLGEFKVAKAYILYRQMRAAARGAKRPDPDGLSSYIHASKYARYREDLGRRETYLETVARVEDMHLRRFPELAQDISWAFDFVRDKRVLPSMRAMQFGGPAMEANHNRGYNCAFTLIDRPRAFAEAFYLLLCGCGVGYSVQYRHVDRLPPIAHQPKNPTVVHHVVEDTIEGWADALNALVAAAIGGWHVEFSYAKIRDRGAPLKTSGGKAPGHLPLKKALERAREMFLGAQGRQLRPIEVHEILCYVADAVLAGGIRRSAMIALFSLEDGEMMYCKSDASWFAKKPHLARANNSVVLKRDEVTWEQYSRIFKMTRNFGEPGFHFVADWDHGCNPCQPAWATVLTPAGISTMGEVQVGDTIWSGSRWTKITNKMSTGVKSVYAFRTRAGTFYGTENHRVVQEGAKIEACEAESIDVVVGDVPEVVVDVRDVVNGLVLGDGSYHAASGRVFLHAGPVEASQYREALGEYFGAYRPGVTETSYEVRSMFARLPVTYERRIPDEYFNGSASKAAGFLRGLYTANGSVVSNRVTLKAASFTVIEQVQQMLSALGIRSYYTVNKPYDVEHKNGVYTSRQSYDLNIGTLEGCQKFARLIGFIQKHKTDKLAASLDRSPSPRLKTTYDIVEREFISEEEVFDITVEADEHTYWTGGLLVSNCNEAGLDPVLVLEDGTRLTGWSFCNLCEINAAAIKTEEDFAKAALAATLIGTLQSAYTDMPYLGSVTERITRRDSLLGIGMTGMQDAAEIVLDPEIQRDIAQDVRNWNLHYASKVGVEPAARTTLVKPSGTTTLELMCEMTPAIGSGIHRHHHSKYIRRVTADELENAFQHFRAKNPSMCAQRPDGTWCIEYPVEVTPGSRLRDEQTAVEFLAEVRSTQQNWVLPGTARDSHRPGLTHNVSNTVSVRPHEWDEVAAYLWEHRGDFAGVSFLPHDGDQIYPFAPFEAVKTPAQEKRWRELVDAFVPVDYTEMREDEDATSLGGEAACAGGACER